MPKPAAYVFDAYGTLFDVHSAAARHAAVIGPGWERLSQIWRVKQLEYTWVWAATGRHTTFAALTEAALDFAAASIGGVPDGCRAELLGAYRRLGAYPEVDGVLRRLRGRGVQLAILSNGDPDMLADAIDAAGLAGLFDHVVTVHEAGNFKPVPAVYRLVVDRLGVDPAVISFQSSNRWDIAGAKVAGFGCVWINRTGQPDEYRETPPDRVLPDLTGLLED